MSAKRTYKKTMTGVAEFIFRKGAVLDGDKQVDEDFSQLNATTTITCDTLGGGTYEVQILPPGALGYKIHETARVETDTVVIPRDVIFEAIKVVTTNPNAVAVVNSRNMF